MKKYVLKCFLLTMIITCILFTSCGEENKNTESTSASENKSTVTSESANGETEESAECKHEWIEATCKEPETCAICGETRGELGEHKWVEANCNTPKTCSVCGAKEGRIPGHTWIPATCTTPRTCSVCGYTEGETAEHEVKDWQIIKEASCSEEGLKKGKCEVCGDTVEQVIEKTEHSFGEWQTVKEPTCSEEGIMTRACSVCGEIEEQAIEKTEHTPGDWIVVEAAGYNTQGKRSISCTVCGKELKTESYELSEDEKEAAFKAECSSYSYDQIARDPDTYLMTQCVYTGEVIQVMENSDGTLALRVNITKGQYYYEDTIYVETMNSRAGKPRILEDDIVTVYGYNSGIISYTTVLGATVSIPSVIATYIDIN